MPATSLLKSPGTSVGSLVINPAAVDATVLSVIPGAQGGFAYYTAGLGYSGYGASSPFGTGGLAQYADRPALATNWAGR